MVKDSAGAPACCAVQWRPSHANTKKVSLFYHPSVSRNQKKKNRVKNLAKACRRLSHVHARVHMAPRVRQTVALCSLHRSRHLAVHWN